MKFSAKKALIVAPDFPYPPNHGARVDIWWRIKILARLGFQVDLIATIKEEPHSRDIEKVHKYVRTIKCYKRRRRISGILSLTPWQIESRGILESIKFSDTYDIVFLEGHFVTSILSNPNLQAPIKILRIQNNEAVYFKELAQSVKIGPRKLFFLLESLKFSRMETRLSDKVKNMMYISKDEYEENISRFPDTNYVFLPPSMASDKFKRVPLESKNVIFIGSLFMANNQEAIQWYIQNVHPLLEGIEDYKFIIAGNSRGVKQEWLLKIIRDIENIKFIDTPEDLEPLYRESSVCANSMLHGAGVKLKTIEAIQNGLPVVSTTIGNQGTGLEHNKDILVTDVPKQFAEYIKELLSSKEKSKSLVENAQQTLRDKYDQEKILEDYLTLLFNRKES
jgi:glycosyltransferase involved in cell wall biosynthesis